MLFRNGIINPTEVQTNIKMQNIFKDTVFIKGVLDIKKMPIDCLLYTSPSPRDRG